MVSENSYGDPVKREIIRVEPLSTYLERWKAPTSAVTARYFPRDPPARIFVCIPAWPGPFDIEMDWVAALP
jgi:2-iminobutanoate/2-iminopropanoate deaminase